MTTDTFASPDPVDIIPADRIRPLIAATERELEVLERTAAEAIAAADDAEEWERAATNDGTASTWTLIRLHREQRDEAQRDAQVMIELATRHAQHLLAEAHADADVFLTGGTPPGPTGVAVGESPGRGPRAAASSDSISNSISGSAPASAPIAVPPVAQPPNAPKASSRRSRNGQATAVLDLPTVADAPVAPEAPTVQIPIAVVPPAVVTAPLVHESPFVHEPPTARDAPVARDTPVVREAFVAAAPPVDARPATESAPVPQSPQSVQPSATDGFWAVEGESRRRWALPISAVLEAAAVLLILVFILLRLS